MILRMIVVLGLLAFAVGAFLDPGPTQIEPNPYGPLFLGLAALAWFGWKPMLAGLKSRDAGTYDVFARQNLGDTPRKKSDI